MTNESPCWNTTNTEENGKCQEKIFVSVYDPLALTKGKRSKRRLWKLFAVANLRHQLSK